MADLFQIGYGGGPPKAIDYSKALDPLAQKINTRLKETKAKTDALINNMPQGVPIDKVPEQLRGQVTDFLTKNKQAYVEASKIIASGIPSTDQRYIDAVSTINQVDAKFKNLSNTLEDIALKRQAALDGREHGKGALSWQISDHEDLANGTMYDNMTIQEDGGFNYKSNDNVEKRWSDYSNTFQTSSVGSDSFYGLNDGYAKTGQQGVAINETRAREQFRGILSGLKTDGARDFMFSDQEFLATKIKADFGTDEYNNELNKLVNGGNTETLLKEFEDFKVKQLTTSNTNGINQYNNLLALKTPGETKENNAAIIKQLERGDKYIKYDQYNTLVKRDDGTYTLIENKNKNRDLSDLSSSPSSDWIKFFGGTATSTGNNILNDGNIKTVSGSNSGMKEIDVRDVQQID